MKNSVLIKIFAILCILCMSLAVCACGGNNNDGDTDHTHSFVEGKCACGETDPNYQPEHTHLFIDGECRCGALENESDNNDGLVTYTVTVVDQDGAPVVGVYIQMCVGDICKLPSPTDENGVAVFEGFDPAEYSVKINGATGYTVEAAYQFEAGSTELTITLTKTAE